MKLYEKLHAIQCAVMGLKKDTKGNNYQYVSGAKVLEHIKPLMNQHKLILKQEVLSIDNVRQDYQTRNGSKSEINSKVMMRFTWVDCESGEKDENLFGANGQNDWDKGVGSALTYGERYFLLKFFHIDTDEDDIDNPNRPTSDPVPPKAEKIADPIADIKAKVSTLNTVEELNAYYATLKNNTPAVIAIFADRKKEITK